MFNFLAKRWESFQDWDVNRGQFTDDGGRLAVDGGRWTVDGWRLAVDSKFKFHIPSFSQFHIYHISC